MFAQPVLIFEGDSAALRRTYELAQSRDVTLAIYTRELFKTFNDVDNRLAVALVPSEQLDLVGLALRADRKLVDKLTMHR